MPSLGGSLFVLNGIRWDYCFMEVVACLLELCDEVSVLDAGSTDGTVDALRSIADSRLTLTLLDGSEWNALQGYTRLAVFKNYAIEKLTTDWNLNLEADEVLHEDSFDAVREAIQKPSVGGYLLRRFNLWGDAGRYLDVPDSRKPVSDYVWRLARTEFRAGLNGDAESLEVTRGASEDCKDALEIYHVGFVRDRRIMADKIRHMGRDVYGWGEDPRLSGQTVFNPYQFFRGDDLKPIPRPLPRFVKEWAAERE